MKKVIIHGTRLTQMDSASMAHRERLQELGGEFTMLRARQTLLLINCIDQCKRPIGQN